MDTDVAGQLQMILVADGADLAGDPRQVGEQLTELCPQQPLEVSLLVAAAEQGSATALLERTGTPVPERIATLSQELAQARNLSGESATWAVQAWAFALGTGARSPGALPRPRPAPGRGRGRLLLAGAAAVTLVVALAVLVPRLVNGSGEKADPDPAGLSAAEPAGSTQLGALKVLAHQGGFETYPLETLPAFEAAAKAGATVETDVHWTADGVAVMVHDDRTTPASEGGREHPMVCQGGPYTVSQTRWDVLRSRCRTLAAQSKDGRSYPIPTFDATMKAIAALPEAQIVVEMKPEQPTDEQIRDYLATITKHEMAARTVASSFYPEALTRIRTQAEKDQTPVRTLLMLRPTAGQDLPTPDKLGSQGWWGVALRSDIATRGNVAGLRAKKLAVVVWTVNSVDQWSAARSAQADLVLTDRPTAYLSWLP